MQLERQHTLRAALSSACVTLLCHGQNVSAADTSWEYESGLLVYAEEDRTSGVEWIAEGRFEQDNDEKLTVRLEFDSIGGSSPNGVAASNQEQTFTTPSGRDSYTVPANTLPTDPTFNDQRLGVLANKTVPLSRLKQFTYGAGVSQEFDYFNLDASLALQQETNQKNTVFDYGLWGSYGRVHPVGGAPAGLASMAPEDALQPRDTAAKTRRQIKGWIGLTQNLDRTSRIGFNLELHRQNGYLTDPYKLIGVVDDVNATTLGAPVDVIYENRPRTRLSHSLDATYKLFINPDAVKLNVRLYSDDWGVHSQTLGLSYRFRQDDASYWEPLVRLYRQSAADFYRHSLGQSETTPDVVSADLRLAEFTAITLGVSYGAKPEKNRKSSWQLLYYQQDGEHSPADAIGSQAGQDLFPTLRTLILQYVYSVEW